MSDYQAVTEVNPGAVTVADMEFAMRFSESMAKSAVTIPKHLVDKPADCMAIILQAKRWGMDPYAVAQGTALINGSLSYSAQLVSAVVSSTGAIDGGFEFEYSGAWKNDKDPDAWVKCGARIKGNDSITWGAPLYPATVTVKNSPLWKTAPKQQASYLAVKYWARLYAPGAILGVSTSDELMQRKERDITPEALAASGRLDSAMARSASIIAKIGDDGKPGPGQTRQAKLIEAINSAGTEDDLKAAVVSIGTDDLSDDAKSKIRAAYSAALAELKDLESD